MIGITLIALFSATFFSSPFTLLRNESKEIDKLEMCRITEDSLLTILEEINTIPWNAIGEECKAALHVLEPIQLSKNQCNRAYSFFTTSQIRIDPKSGVPYKKGIVKLSLEYKGEKLETRHHVVVYAKTAHSL